MKLARFLLPTVIVIFLAGCITVDARRVEGRIPSADEWQGKETFFIIPPERIEMEESTELSVQRKYGDVDLPQVRGISDLPPTPTTENPERGERYSAHWDRALRENLTTRGLREVGSLEEADLMIVSTVHYEYEKDRTSKLSEAFTVVTIWDAQSEGRFLRREGFFSSNQLYNLTVARKIVAQLLPMPEEG